MSRQRLTADKRLRNINTSRRSPRLSEPLSFHESPPTSILGQLWFHLRELFQLARHIFFTLVFGVGYDMTPTERQQALRQQERRLSEIQSEKKADTVILGYIRNTHQLLWNRNDSTVTLCGDVVAGELDSFTHAVRAYNHLGLSPTDKHARLIRYTGQSALITLPSSTSQTFPAFEYAPFGSLQSFIATTPSYPYLAHPAIPPHAARSALPFHWLLNLASGIAFLHSHRIAHRALALDLAWLRTDFSAALFDLSCSVFTKYDDEWDEDLPVMGDLLSWGSFSFPFDDVDITYYSGATPEDAMALGKAMDVFDFGTAAWRIINRTVGKAPEWTMPTRPKQQRTWTLSELRDRLREAVGQVRDNDLYEPSGMEVVKRCWRLEYRDGNEVLEALKKTVLKTGLRLQRSDEIEGVTYAVEEFKKCYKPKSYLGNEVVTEQGYI